MDDTTKNNLNVIKGLKAANNENIADPASSPKESDWVPEEFKKNVLRYKKYVRVEKGESIGHCKIFWGWYAGLISAPDQIDALACGILSPIVIDGFHVLHEDLVGTEVNIPDSTRVKKAEVYTIYSVGSAITTQTVLKCQSGATLSVTQCKSWINNILDILETENLATYEKLLPTLTNIQRLTALVFLNCCRLATKDPQQVQEHIASTIVNRASSLFSIPMAKIFICPAFVVPSYNFIVTFTEVIKKGAALSKQILGRIIYSHVYAKDANESVRSVYRTGCLLSLSYTGLSPVAWLVKAAKAKSLTQVQLLEKLYIPKMESFITKYLSLAKFTDSSWVYCRLISDSALLKLSASSEPLATAVFVALCYNPKAPDMTVWEIPSLQCISYEDVVRAHCIAEAMMESPELLAEQVPLTDEAKALTDKLKITSKDCYGRQQTLFRSLFNQNRTLLPKNVNTETQDQAEQDDGGEESDDEPKDPPGPSSGDHVSKDGDPSGDRFE